MSEKVIRFPFKHTRLVEMKNKREQKMYILSLEELLERYDVHTIEDLLVPLSVDVIKNDVAILDTHIEELKFMVEQALYMYAPKSDEYMYISVQMIPFLMEYYLDVEYEIKEDAIYDLIELLATETLYVKFTNMKEFKPFEIREI